MSVDEHIEKDTSVSMIITPTHEDRTESAEFCRSKKRLKEDGHFQCYICGATNELQVHHRGCEWSEQGVVDYALLKEFCEEWDIYGYGKLLKAKPITTVDDIRNQMVLCQEHHTGTNSVIGNATGIHNCPFTIWIMQKLHLKGKDPVPQEGETLAAAQDRI